MRGVAAAFLIVCGVFALGRPAAAAVSIDVDLTTQTMHVTSPETGATYDWRVSTAASGYATPHGVYHPQSLQVMHYSHKYHMSPMPHSIFFHGGYAIHGTYSVADLGRPASHGCIRLDPQNAALLFGLVKAEGADITISGTPPAGHRVDGEPAYHHRKVAVAKAHRHHRIDAASAHRHHHRASAYAWSHVPVVPLAYAPSRAPAPLKSWLHNPARF